MATPAFAQETIPEAGLPEDLGAPPDAGPGHGAPAGHGETTEAHGGEHGGFPPFEPATFASQLVWLAITFGLLYWLMSRVALPRMATILGDRDARIAGDLAEAERLKAETDAALAAYEQGLAEARQRAHAIAGQARDASKAAVDAERRGLDAELNGRMADAESRIAAVTAEALTNVGAIAGEATEALVETLLGAGVPRSEIEGAVGAVMAERS